MRNHLQACRFIFLVVLVLSSLISGHAQNTPVAGKPPAYPLAAKAAGVDGPVVLQVTVTKQGTVQNVRVVSGPAELRQAAIDAVSNWTYKPYHHFGRAVEVDTTITVNFNMGNGEKKKAAQAKAQAETAQAARTLPAQADSKPPTPRQ